MVAMVERRGASTGQRRAPRSALLLLGGAAAAFVATVRNAFVSPPASSQEQETGRRELLWRAVGAGAVLPAVAQNVISGGTEAAWAAGARWSGRYIDPKHPGCDRKITKKKDRFEISGQTSPDGPGCPAGAKNLRKWFIYGETNPGEWPARSMTIDFSNKGGPKGIVAKWAGNGIIFPDGNRWEKKPSPIMNEGQAGLVEDESAGDLPGINFNN
eukprot:TRINITY_DN31046_c0_g1_i1.p1 TRINITY_DN31046_c0_g1~~TRINITY_DN31046_c0_g1_i1.p1  ORF type:complete len:214 (-),score=52.62 TRINITY_DN31046_c0_g1_i1:138-779(-)